MSAAETFPFRCHDCGKGSTSSEEHIGHQCAPTLPEVDAELEGAIAALDAPDVPLTDAEARQLAAEMADRVTVSAEVEDKTPEQKADDALGAQVFECPHGHQQHGPCEMVATSKLTEQVIARSGASCIACQVLWFGRNFPTFPLSESANRSARRKLAAAKRKKKWKQRKGRAN